MPVIALALNDDGSLAEDGAFRRLYLERGAPVHVGDETEITLAGLTGGMASGRPSVAFGFPLPDGRWVLAETSLALLLTAADALRARFGDPRT